MSVEINLGTEEQEDQFDGTTFETESDVDERIDRLGELLAWEAANKADPRTKELAKLKKDLTAEAAASEPQDEVVLKGNKFMVTVSKPSTKRTIKEGGAEAIHGIMGDEAFYGMISVSLGKIDDYLTPEQRKKVLNVDEFGGSRSLSCTALPKG